MTIKDRFEREIIEFYETNTETVVMSAIISSDIFYKLLDYYKIDNIQGLSLQNGFIEQIIVNDYMLPNTILLVGKE